MDATSAPEKHGAARVSLKTAVLSLATWRSVGAWIFSILLVSSIVIGARIVFAGDVLAGLSTNYVTPFSVFDALAIAMGAPIVALAVMLLAQAVERTDVGAQALPSNLPRGRKALLLVLGFASALFIAWSPYLLTYAPGSIVGDTLGSLTQHPGAWSNHYPFVFTLLLRLFANAGIAAGNINYGIFAYTCFQSLLMAAALGYAVYWLAEKGVAWYWCAATWVYFAFVPIFPIYAIGVQKDALFSLAVAALTLFVFDVVQSKGALLRTGRGIAGFLALAAATIFLRNNGVYVAFGTAVALALAYRGGPRLFYASVVVLLAAAFLIQGPGYDRLGVKKDTFVESVGVPLQQIAYVISTHGQISAAQQQFLGHLLPSAEWAEKYAPACVDPLKRAADFREDYLVRHERRFLETWVAVVIHNPVSAFKAYCLGTFGFWKIGVSSTYGYADTYVHSNDLGIRAADLIREATGVSAKPFLDGLRGRNGTAGYVSVGLVVWMMFLVGALLAIRRRGELIVVLVPCFLLWLTVMVATPVAFSLRYVFALSLCLPGILLLPFANGSRAAG